MNPVKNVGRITSRCWDMFGQHPQAVDWKQVQRDPELAAFWDEVFTLASAVPFGSRPIWIGKIVGLGKHPHVQVPALTVKLASLAEATDKVMVTYVTLDCGFWTLMLGVCNDSSTVALDAWESGKACPYTQSTPITKYLGWEIREFLAMRENSLAFDTLYQRQRKR